MRRLLAVFAVCACLCCSAFGWVEETGTLRGFVLGHCPGCAHDNWTSHVVEGVALPGYNDYGPAWFNPQTNGFGHFTYLAPNDTAANRTLSQWRNVFNAAVSGQWAQVDSALQSHQNTWRYELVRLQDSELNRIFFVLRERLDSSFVDANVDSIATDDVIGSFRNGWGVFVFNTAPLFPKLSIQIVHPGDDFLSIPVGIELFIRTNARAFMIAGAGREVLWDTTQHSYNNSNSLSDPSRNGRQPLEMCHEALFDALDAGPTSEFVTVQMHSYDHLLHHGEADVQVSAFADDSHPNPPLRDRAAHEDLVHFMGEFPVQGIPVYPTVTRRIDRYLGMLSSPSYAYYSGSDTLTLPGVSLPGAGGNVQAVYSHRNHNIDRDPENFIHVELDEYPDAMWSPERWHDWLPGNMPATIETFQPALSYYAAFIAAMDSALRRSHLYPDTLAPLTVHLDQVIHAAADTVVVRWSPAAADRFFDSYFVYYDTTEISGTSPYFWRQSTGQSALQDFSTVSATLRGFTRPVSAYRFAVGSRDIFGNTAVRSNTASVTGGTVAFRMSNSYLGCGDACRNDTLYLTFSEAGFLTGQMFVILPPELEVAWPAGNQSRSVMPTSNIAANLVFAIGRRIGSASSDTLEINVQWQPPYSDGNYSRYIAAIPIHNQSASQTVTLPIRGGDSTIFFDSGGPRYNQFSVGPAYVYNDCAAPVSSIGFKNAPTCAFGSATSLQGKLSIAALRGGTPANSPLTLAYVEVNSNSAQRVMLFTAPQSGNYSNSAFPSAADSTLLWGYLTEGCNNLIVHAFDASCNEGVSSSVVVVKDAGAPALSISNSDSTFGFNNIAGSPHYGGTMLDNHLDISTNLGAGACTAGSGTATISYGSQTFPAFTLPPDLAGYPASDSTGQALWNWMISVVPATANGEYYGFTVRVQDCAGNSRTGTFSLKLDLTPPLNSFAHLDARPTDMGVWLDWTWNYDAAQAVSMEIWRSSYPGDYPSYATNRWANLANAVYYPRAYPPAGFVKVVEQNGLLGTSSTVYTALNGKGAALHGGPAMSYWMDEDSSWRDDHERRDIYRYVTFVKDAAGNMSAVSAYSLNVNADRSTNYWLGDFSRDALPDPNGSSGSVNTADLTLLSAYYFTSTPPSPGYYDIGPENGENGMGKGIPMPNGQIDFTDLVPFSINFGATGPRSFSVAPHAVDPDGRLNEPPVVRVVRTDSIPIGVGGTFQVVVVMEGNSSAGVRATETRLCFDADVLELLSVSADSLNVVDGIPFVSAKSIAGETGTIGFAAAAIGEQAHFAGEAALGSATFRWKNLRAANTEISLQNTKAADVNGTPQDVSVEGLALGALNALPSAYTLYQNYPNPFNPSTRIRYDVADDVHVRLEIFNCLGQRVAVLVNEPKAAGSYTAIWDGGNHTAAGIYICRMQAGSFVDYRKLILLK